MDLYLDDIEDQVRYPDEVILNEVRALIKAGQREGPMLDYKKDVSDKDNWPEAVAAFANSFGGLIIFGVEGKGDEPCRLTGLDPKGVEIKTKIGSMILSRIQPRPEFHIRIVRHDEDPGREIVILRISEGSHPPYMHSKDDAHRIYVRVGAQKAEADYLQLAALFEKRHKVESAAGSFIVDLAGPQSMLYMTEPGTNHLSRHFYKFVVAPDNERASRRLNVDTEREFKECIDDLYQVPITDSPSRTYGATYLKRGTGTPSEHLFALTAKGAVGLAADACIKTNDGPFFIPWDFCRNLVDFLILNASLQERRQYYGESLLHVELVLGDKAHLYPGAPTRFEHLKGGGLFEPPLQSIQTDKAIIVTRIALHPIGAERLLAYLDEVMNDLARLARSVLSRAFRSSILPLVEDTFARASRAF